ncbi:MAG TPA: alpha-L-rhamnosidase, partial [Opitutaceae bacterium]
MPLRSPSLSRVWLLSAAAALCACAAAPSPLRAAVMNPVDLRCEHCADPQGIDEASPRLSWRVESTGRAETQSAFRILVASSPGLLAQEKGDLWDSGRVAGDETQGTAYAGSPLASREWCYWKVCVWDRDGAPSWSAPAE